MKKLFASILFISMVMAFAGCSQAQPASQNQNTYTTPATTQPITIPVTPSSDTATNTPTNTPTTAPTISGTSMVNIQNFSFNPATLTIKAGTTVKWSNNDSAPHQIKSDTGAFESQVLSTGDSFEFKFDTAGTYNYHCNIHPSMTGQIVVE